MKFKDGMNLRKMNVTMVVSSLLAPKLSSSLEKFKVARGSLWTLIH